MPDFAQLDRELFRAVHVGWHNPALDKPALLVTYSGDGWQIVLVLLCLLKKAWREAAAAAIASYLLAGAVRLLIILFIHRQRPSNLAFAHPLEPIYGDTSFPSGHTTTTWAIAMAVCLFASGPRRTWIQAGVVAWAVLVAMSRVYIGVHYPGDVIGGAALGCLAAGVVSLAWPRLRRTGPTAENGHTEPS